MCVCVCASGCANWSFLIGRHEEHWHAVPVSTGDLAVSRVGSEGEQLTQQPVSLAQAGRSTEVTMSAMLLHISTIYTTRAVSAYLHTNSIHWI